MGTFQHANVGATLTQAEFEGVDLHTVSGQAAGDMMYADSADSWERVAVGDNGEYLQLVLGVPTWAAASISINADDLLGTVLASGVVTSSLTALGIIATGTWSATPVTYAYGGTGLSSYAQGDLVYASAANTLAKLALGDADEVLTVNAGGTQMEWKAASGGGGGFGTSYAVNLLFGKR
tara:strand:- start:1098 stop:1634 length:537 start_codon:yes stop_codon:yes gene_type:complete